MRKRRTILLLIGLAIVVVVGLLVSGAYRSREPEYEAKKLSEWVKGDFRFSIFDLRFGGFKQPIQGWRILGIGNPG